MGNMKTRYIKYNENSCFKCENKKAKIIIPMRELSKYEIIGNTWQNPELLEVKG